MKSLTPLKIGIIGLGPVGSVLAVHLKVAGMEVFGCDIDKKKITAIQKQGIRLVNAIQRHEFLSSVCRSIPELMKDQLDLVAIAVKAPYLSAVISQLEECKGSFFVLSAQNGIDNEQELARVFGPERTLRMVINYAGNMVDQSTVQVTFFNPPNYLAPLRSEGRELVNALVAGLDKANLETQIPERINYFIWEKAILNASLSPVCALTGKTMQEVMDYSTGRELVTAIIKEGIQVAAAAGIVFPAGFVSHCLHYLDQGGNHRPSMLVDLDLQRPTEINQLNGKLVEYGLLYGIETPMNRTVTTLIRLLEQEYLSKN